MLKIKITNENESNLHEFEKCAIIIGRMQSSLADIKIKGEEIKDEHLKIIVENGKYFVINVTNDPLVSINDLPFYKKEINSKDIIQIEHYSISVLPEAKKPDQNIRTYLEEIDVTLTDKEVESTNIEDLFREVDLLEEQEKTSKTEENKIEKKPKEKQKNVEPKTYYLKDFDDESENWDAKNGKESEKTNNLDIKSYLLLFLALVVVCTFILSGVYYRESGRNSQEEKKLAAGISDIAMAMTYAKIYHIFPNKQNWTDPDFIRNNLSFVLAPNIHTQAQIDGQGQFYKYPYILRVYVSTNQSNFLVIAQPSSNLLHWFVYKKSLVIDSRTMEIRQLADLKDLNRLLANPKPLEGKNGDEIYKVVQSGAPMPITSLTGIKNRWGFNPPKTLSYIRNKAENYIYNAPRYYPFGEEILNKAVQLYNSQASNLEVIELKEEMEEISKFADMVLYTSKGLNHALKAQKSLSTFAPNSKFLIAYVKFNSNGFVTSSNLLINEGQNESTKSEDENDFLDDEDLGIDNSYEVEFRDNITVDRNHPLFLQLLALKKERFKTLKTLGDKISFFIAKNNQIVDLGFEEKLLDLIEEYKKIDSAMNQKIENDIKYLYEEYSDIPYEKFTDFTDSTNLTPLLSPALEIASDLSDKKLDDPLIDKGLKKIKKSKNFQELKENVQNTVKFINIEHLGGTDLLIYYQDIVHNLSLQKIAHFLLSPKSKYSNKTPNSKEKFAFLDTLKMAWVTESDERDYFVDEFDLLFER